jgi:predicted dehydrogenase
MLNVGIIGCGSISSVYLKNLAASSHVRVIAVADLDPAKAHAAAALAPGATVLSTTDLIASPAVDLVLNLTTPHAHASIARAALEAGKHIYNEKPLTIDLDDARSLLDLAASRDRLVGCAPDTVLGAGIQTCKQLIDAGAIGRPVGGVAFMLCPGHESWHPDPAFYYQHGGGPVLDMGPYYLSALVTLLGPASRVNSLARTTHATRTITSQPKQGQTIAVEVPTHATGLIEFASGAMVSVVFSFDVQATTLPPIELWGTGGSIRVPDPNGFGGPVSVFSSAAACGSREWTQIPLLAGRSDNARGLGVEDMAVALAEGRTNLRASGQQALHVLEIMHALNRDQSVTLLA